MYSQCLHEGLTPKTLQAGCHISCEDDNRRRLSGSVGFTSTLVHHGYCLSVRQTPFLLACSFVFQLSVFSTGYCRILTNPHLLSITSHYFPLLPIASHYFPLLPITSHYFPLLPIASHYFPLLPINSHCFPCLSTLHSF
jgi:hypothetical protein